MTTKAVELQAQIRQNNDELMDYLKDLNRWQDDIKKEDSNLKLKKKMEEYSIPPVRSSSSRPEKAARTVSAESTTVSEEREGKRRIKSSDYDAWSKFDVEKACEDIDNVTRNDREDDETEEEEQEQFEQGKRAQQANMEKEKGNQLFNDGKYEAAISRYTNAVTLDPTNPIYYANRGMALLKVERYGAAEQDCSTALAYDPKYTKALARRATARQKLKRYADARSDYEQLLKLEPNNKQAMQELQKLIAEEKRLSQSKPQGSERHPQPVKNGLDCSVQRKPRSNKPLRRIPVEEIGGDDTDVPSPLDAGVEETATTERQIHNSRVPPVHALSSSGVIAAVPPSSSFQFETDFKRLRHNQEDLYKYLKLIPTCQYAKLFHQCIDTLLSPFINCLHDCYMRDSISFLEEMIAVTAVPRFRMAVMFLTSKDKQVLGRLLTHLNSAPNAGMASAGTISELAVAYGVKL